MRDGWSRRRLLAAGLSLGALGGMGALCSAAQRAPAQGKLRVMPARRVIIDNDFAGDPDGLVALVHQLLSPTTRVTAITSSFLNPRFLPADAPAHASARAGADIARDLLRLLPAQSSVPVYTGAEQPLPGAAVAAPSDAAAAIVAEAMRDDPLPLFVTCGGPLTNVASALLTEPRIADRMTLAWIGGADHRTGGWEYNLATDVAAAQAVFAQPRLPVWQVTSTAYRGCQFSLAELEQHFRHGGPLGQWLWRHFTMPLPDWIRLGGTWALGDSPLVLLTALASDSSRFADLPTPSIVDEATYGPGTVERRTRVYESIDTRLMFGDFLARLTLQDAAG